MKISIITVVFNNEKTISDAIESIISQTHKDIEYIVIDGKSTDGTLNIISSYTNAITTLVSEPDKGLYDAMNKGIKLATGDIIGILNSDDLYNDANVLSDVCREFEEDDKLSILYGDLVYVNADDTTKVVRNWKSKKYYENFFEHGNVPPHPALFVRHHIYSSCGLFNLQYRLASDYDFMLRIFKEYGETSKYLPRLMVRMRLGGATNKSFKNIMKGNREIIQSWRRNEFRVPIMLMPMRLLKRLIQFF
jgi:glycosyltransferase involved in cell wall biosynthesis